MKYKHALPGSMGCPGQVIGVRSREFCTANNNERGVISASIPKDSHPHGIDIGSEMEALSITAMLMSSFEGRNLGRG